MRTRFPSGNPLLLAVSANVGFILAAAHRYDEAIAECRKTLDLDPNFPLGHYRLGQIYTLKGMYSEAIPELETAVAVSRSSPRATAELGLAHALNGNRAEALRYAGSRDRTQTVEAPQPACRQWSSPKLCPGVCPDAVRHWSSGTRTLDVWP